MHIIGLIQPEHREAYGAYTYSRRRVVMFSLRFTLYTLLIFALTYALTILIVPQRMRWFEENGPVEWVQFGVLAFITVVLLIASVRQARFRELLLVLAGWVGFAAVRELDALLDRWVPWVGWKLAVLFVLAPLVLVVVRWGSYRLQLVRFLMMPGFFLFWAGFVVAVPVAQLLGHGPLIEAVMAEGAGGYSKRVIEESGETIGYLVMAAACFETLINMSHPLIDLRPADAGKTERSSG